jgi:epoxyqueuosine reductase
MLFNKLDWLTEWMQAQEIELWGVADLRDISTPSDLECKEFPYAVSFAIPINPEIMRSIQNGPNQLYAAEYVRVNSLIDERSTGLANEFISRGFQSQPLVASERYDPVNMKGMFPHKTAATRAGLGWIGLHCQLITRPFGSWVRLGTVFIDNELPCGPAAEENHCGNCTRCVEACPAKALKGRKWYPGLPREEILDVQACENWKKVHYHPFHNGDICGICSAVCPYGGRTKLKV